MEFQGPNCSSGFCPHGWQPTPPAELTFGPVTSRLCKGAGHAATLLLLLLLLLLLQLPRGYKPQPVCPSPAPLPPPWAQVPAVLVGHRPPHPTHGAFLELPFVCLAPVSPSGHTWPPNPHNRCCIAPASHAGEQRLSCTSALNRAVSPLPGLLTANPLGLPNGGQDSNSLHVCSLFLSRPSLCLENSYK